jgi:hypothetical protein
LRACRGGAPQQRREQPRALNLLVDAAVGLEAEAAAAAAAVGARGPRPRTPPSDVLLHKPVGGLGRFFLRPEDGWAARPRPFSRTNKASKAGVTKVRGRAGAGPCPDHVGHMVVGECVEWRCTPPFIQPLHTGPPPCLPPTNCILGSPHVLISP